MIMHDAIKNNENNKIIDGCWTKLTIGYIINEMKNYDCNFKLIKLLQYFFSIDEAGRLFY